MCTCRTVASWVPYGDTSVPMTTIIECDECRDLESKAAHEDASIPIAIDPGLTQSRAWWLTECKAHEGEEA